MVAFPSPLQHSILKPFMLRRVKTDVVSELTSKTEVTVHCKLSSRQQAFYQAIKNKISLAELFDSNRGHLNEKKILNLMNIVIQLRKVCCQFYWGFLLFHYIWKYDFDTFVVQEMWIFVSFVSAIWNVSFLVIACNMFYICVMVGV